MKVAEAKSVARAWVDEVASQLSGFEGAFFHGSICEMEDEGELPESSDVDVGVVLAGPGPLPKLGKALRDGVLVDGAAVSKDLISSSERLLGSYRIAPSFRRDGIIADPTGEHRRVQAEVERRFSEPRWVAARCEDARQNCLEYVRLLDTPAPGFVHVIQALFAAGALSHVVLVAGLRNPTVRRRYSAARNLLAARGRLDLHEQILAVSGFDAISPESVGRHLDGMTAAFDAAASVARSSYPFGTDISAIARPVAVNGTAALLRGGEHREALFWIGVTWARCLAVLDTDGGAGVAVPHERGFDALLAELGTATADDRRERVAAVEDFLPQLMDEVAGGLI